MGKTNAVNEIILKFTAVHFVIRFRQYISMSLHGKNKFQVPTTSQVTN